ncbi:MAG: hypothetical protein KDA79_12145, partial [Planctomycetaceae bacterium]|nr:hypothetical protein [Planctomycetaceae bacterium]
MRQLKEAQVGQVSHTSSSASSMPVGARHNGRLSGSLILAVLFLSAGPAYREAAAQQEPPAGAAPAAIPLPKGFSPPPKIPPVMEMENELLTKDEDERLEKELRRDRYSSILRSGQVNDRTRKVIETGARWRAQRL